MYLETILKMKENGRLCLSSSSSPAGDQAFGDTPCCEDHAVALPDEVMGYHLSPHWDRLHLEASVHL